MARMSGPIHTVQGAKTNGWKGMGKERLPDAKQGASRWNTLRKYAVSNSKIKLILFADLKKPSYPEDGRSDLIFVN